MTTTTSTPSCKFIVAIHGIGDQIGYATAQSVVTQVGTFCGKLAAVPLGTFYPIPGGGGATGAPIARITPEPRLVPALGHVGFGEVYWAGIAREVSKDGYILEETKKWARTIVAKLGVEAEKHKNPMPASEHFRIITVLDELIETVAVLGRLNTVAEKAGLFKFQLKTLLNDFVGDVQIVADFAAYRQRILDEFSRVMRATLTAAGVHDPIRADDSLPEVYLVGHSEGSVVVFLAVLTALADRGKYPWINAVKGVMTIGSPIEVHHLLWPELWHSLEPDGTAGDRPPIPWHNYLDRGDPIAYELKATNDWLQKSKFSKSFAFKEFPFSRSFVPGKAHTDYWSDDAVFGHFFQTVVGLPRTEAVATPADPVPNRPLAQFTSYVLPQVVIAALHMAATFVLYRAIYAALAPKGQEPTIGDVSRDVVGIGLLLLGMTAVSRIPRLTTQTFWRVLSVIALLVAIGFYWSAVSQPTRNTLGAVFGRHSETGVSIVAFVIAVVSGWASARWPRAGIRVLPLLGLLGTFALVGTRLYEATRADSQEIAIWPIVLASAAFFYLWWLGALLFDLAFVWNVHVRHSQAADHIQTIVREGYVTPSKAVQHTS